MPLALGTQGIHLYTANYIRAIHPLKGEQQIRRGLPVVEEISNHDQSLSFAVDNMEIRDPRLFKS